MNQSLFVVIIVALIERVVFVPRLIPKSYHPFTFVGLLAQRIDEKVRPVEYGSKQQIISGSLSFIVLFGPMICVLFVLLGFAEYRLFFEATILLFCISWSFERRQYQRIEDALAAKKHQLAKNRLKSIVKRDTTVLSNVGVAKAASEALFLRFVFQWLTPLFLYLVVNVLAALIYRLALQCYWEWKRPFTQQSAFAKPVFLLCKLCQIIPSYFVVLLSWLAVLPSSASIPSQVASRHIKRSALATSLPKFLDVNPSLTLLHVLGKRLGFALSGPIQYAGTRHRVGRVGAPYQIRLHDMSRIRHVILTLEILVFSAFIAAFVIRFYRYS